MGLSLSFLVGINPLAYLIIESIKPVPLYRKVVGLLLSYTQKYMTRVRFTDNDNHIYLPNYIINYGGNTV